MDNRMELDELLRLIGDGLVHVDTSGVPYQSAKPPYRQYGLGVGPYSESVLCKRLAEYLAASHADRCAGVCTRRIPDLLLPGSWAVELKIARPFGDNGKEAEHWSQNLLHPYPGNTSSLSDAIKLTSYSGSERRAVVVVGYEHTPARIDLDPLIAAFEAIAREVLRLPISARHQHAVGPLIHPVHQIARLWAWEVCPRA